MGVLQFDDEAAKQLIAVYVTPDVVAQRNDFLQVFAPRSGERVLDVGSGPGFLASAIAVAVGPSGLVRGVDISEPFVTAARATCAHQSWAEFQHGDATRLPFPNGSFDAAVSTQVLEYVSEVDRALAELHRVVRAGGRVAILDTDWDSIVWHSPDRARMDRVLEAWEAHAADSHLPRTLANRMRAAGFEVEPPRVLPLLNPTYNENTYSNRMIDMIARFVAGRGGITTDEARAWAEDLRQLGERGEYFFSLNRYAFVARKS
jgi:ubiquinone/menaquinone biosynthesis C-methylase UbiE